MGMTEQEYTWSILHRVISAVEDMLIAKLHPLKRSELQEVAEIAAQGDGTNMGGDYVWVAQLYGTLRRLTGIADIDGVSEVANHHQKQQQQEEEEEEGMAALGDVEQAIVETLSKRFYSETFSSTLSQQQRLSTLPVEADDPAEQEAAVTAAAATAAAVTAAGKIRTDDLRQCVDAVMEREKNEDFAGGLELLFGLLGGVVRRQQQAVEPLFFQLIAECIRHDYARCNVLDEVERPITGGFDPQALACMKLLDKISDFVEQVVGPGKIRPLVDHAEPSTSPFTQLMEAWLHDKGARMLRHVEVSVETEDWTPLAESASWSSSCRDIFDMILQNIDLFFSFVPQRDEARHFCLILLQHVCQVVTNYTWEVSKVPRLEVQAIAENPPPPEKAESEAARLLDERHRTVLQNLDAVKGRLFPKMWAHVTDLYAAWSQRVAVKAAKAAARAESNGTDDCVDERDDVILPAAREEAERIEEATQRQIEMLYSATVQDIDHALGSTVLALGRLVVTGTLRAPFVDHLYRPRVVRTGVGSVADALLQAEMLLGAASHLTVHCMPVTWARACCVRSSISHSS